MLNPPIEKIFKVVFMQKKHFKTELIIFFVEVKSSSARSSFNPVYSVNRRKQEKIIKTASMYMAVNSIDDAFVRVFPPILQRRLVEKEDQVKHETRVVKTLNKYFDAVLVHADPNLAQLNETFDQYEKIEIPIIYTGYIAPRPKTDAAQKKRRRLHIGDDELLIIGSAAVLTVIYVNLGI